MSGWLQDVKSLQQKQDQAVPQKSGTAQPTVSYTVRLIQHSERYADLRYHRYDREASVQPEDPSSFDQMLHKMHPFAVLDVHQIGGSGFPADLALEPSDCLELFNSMQSALQQLQQQQVLDAEAGKEVHAQQQQLEQTTAEIETAQEVRQQQRQSGLQSPAGAAVVSPSKAAPLSRDLPGTLAAEGKGEFDAETLC